VIQALKLASVLFELDLPDEPHGETYWTGCF